MMTSNLLGFKGITKSVSGFKIGEVQKTVRATIFKFVEHFKTKKFVERFKFAETSDLRDDDVFHHVGKRF